MTETAAPEVLWEPSDEAVGASNMSRYGQWLRERRGVEAADYEELWAWSVDQPEEFWSSLWEFFDIRSSSRPERVLGGTSMPGARWFPGARLNYAEHIFRNASADRPALIAVSEDGPRRETSWEQLRQQTAALAGRLRAWGVRPGDRVAAYLPNSEAAVVGLLACASVGAVWACCPPDYGTQSVIDRLQQIDPVVLLVVDSYRHGGREVSRTAEAVRIAQSLPSVKHVVAVSRTADAASTLPADFARWDEVVAGGGEPTFEQVPFEHPLWILYSSGTTGLPKGIVHGHGGIVLEHLKWLSLHSDVRAGDVFFWFTSTAWMVWNGLIGSLLVGATAVLYDGSPVWPDKDRLWSIVEETRTTYFGTSPGYLAASEKAGLVPGESHDLSSLRCLLSTGAPLPADSWRWVYRAVKPDLWLDAPSGGTDICTAYVGGSPLKPVVAGEIQCRYLGMPVESWSEAGEPLIGETGELVVTGPTPSMPLYFWNDPEGKRYHEAYFDVFPGVWRHGDWILITDRGTAVIQGRSDSTINRHGVRMGSAEIHAAVEALDEVAECLVIGAELPDGRYYMPLFVVVAGGASLDDELREAITERIRSDCSPRHVPDEIIQIPAVPHTLTGKRLEVPVKRLIQGVPMERAVNRGVVDRPEVLDFFAEFGRSLRGSPSSHEETRNAGAAS
ncbi:acetoacetate--CoA ligase [Streptomyces sp. GbtcB7]|uniref:acetoacetate--CoA ligase n=1 Tax=Streptomyces sp. GbtcB7 TaxID=2824752 RepID=UPI001C2F73D2|nr:acetoacetate--CoA ligase [Streptomyces sp. GbtcB7]